MAIDEGKILYERFIELTEKGKSVEALDSLDRACALGDKDALLAKAKIIGYEDDAAECEYSCLIDKACEAGSAEAWALKGDLMFSRPRGGEEILALEDGISRENKEKFILRLPLIRKFDCYAQAAELGYIAAYEFLGDALANPENAFLAEKDAEKEAVSYYARGAEKGSENCVLKLAECLEEGFGVEKNIEKALSLYNELATLGNKNAMLHLCEIYTQGREGIEPDSDLARKYMLMTGLSFERRD